MNDGNGSAASRPWKDYWEFRASIEAELAAKRPVEEHERKVQPYHPPRKGLAYHRRIK